MKIGNVEKLVANLHDKKEYVMHIINLNQALDKINSWRVLQKVQEVITFNQKACLKSYIDMNTELRKNAKNDFKKYFFKLINNAVFEKTVENVRNH